MKRFASTLVIAIIASRACLGQSITTVTPSDMDIGQGLSVTIVCANDSLISCSQTESWNCKTITVNSVYFKNGDSIRIAYAFSNVQARSLVASVGFPLSSPTGAWDVAIKHTNDSTLWKAGGFTLNALSDPVVDSMWPNIAYQSKKVKVNIFATHTHFKIAQKDSMVNNVTNAWLTSEASSIKADSFSIQTCTKMQAYFTLKNNADTGLFAIKIDQGNGLPSAVLQKALSIKSIPSSPYSLPDGCIAFYPFEGDAVDCSYNGNNGALSGALTVEGFYGRALRFNGTTDYVEIPDRGSFAVTKGLTISAWIKPEGDSYFGVAGRSNTSNSNNSWMIGGGLTSGITFQMWKNYTYSETPLLFNEWNHIVGTCDGTVMRIYQNGVLQPDSCLNVSVPTDTTISPLYIGKTLNNGYFTGAIDEVMIFNRGLNAAEVNSIYKGMYFANPPNDTAVPAIIPCKPEITLDATPIFAWHPVAKATSYTLSIATDATFSDIVAKIPISDTAFTPLADLPVGPVYWHVKCDLNPRWSLTDNLIVQSDTVPFIKRFDGAVVQSLRPTFVWNKVAKASAYKIEIANNAWFENPSWIYPFDDTTFTPRMNVDTGMIYWRVSCDRDMSLYCEPDSLFIMVKTHTVNRHSPLPAKYSCDLVGISETGAFMNYCLPSASEVSIKLYSLQGKLVKEIVHSHQQPGYYRSVLGISNLSRGYYLLNFKAGAFSLTKRIAKL